MVGSSDAFTHAPVPGARVWLTQKPQVSTYSDVSGRFLLGKVRNFHLAYVPPEGEWPRRKDNYVEVSRPGYLPTGFDNFRGGDVGDILLKPGQTQDKIP